MPFKELNDHCGLAVTLTFDLLISQCDQSILVPNCTYTVRRFVRQRVDNHFVYDHVLSLSHGQPEYRMPSAAISPKA